MVSRMPSIFSFGLICRRTFCTVCKSCSKPFADRYCACTGIRAASAAANALMVSIPSDGIQSSRIKSYSRLALSSTCFSTFSRLILFTNATSSPASSMLAGIRSTPSAWCRMPSPGWMGWSFMAFCIRADSVVDSSSGCCQPMLMVNDLCGSVSTNRTFLPSIASSMPRFSQVVVLPVPPFWLTMAIVVAFFEIFITSTSLSHGWFGSDRKAALWWVHYTEKQADTVSCFGSGCCSLQDTSAQNGYGQRSAS